MHCRFCHALIEEYAKWLFHAKRQVKKFVCPVCGPLHYRTLEPLQIDKRSIEQREVRCGPCPGEASRNDRRTVEA